MPQNILNCILFFDGLLHSINLAYSNVKLVPFPVCIHAPSASPTLRKTKPTCHVEVFGPKVYMCTLAYRPLLPSNQNHAHFFCDVCDVLELFALFIWTSWFCLHIKGTHTCPVFLKIKKKNRCKANLSNVIVSIY